MTFKFLYEFKKSCIYTMLKLSTCKKFEYFHDFVIYLGKIDDHYCLEWIILQFKRSLPYSTMPSFSIVTIAL